MGILVLILILLLIISYFLNKEEILSPAVIFSGSFVYCGLWALAYKEKWNTVLSFNTCLVIGFGVFIYVFTTTIVRMVMERNKTVSSTFSVAPITPIEIDNWKLILFLLFSLIITIGYTRALKSTTGIQSISQAVTAYKQASQSSTMPYSLPRWVNYGRTIVNASGFWFAYVIARNLYVQKKEKLITWAIMLVSMYCFSLTGGRSGSINQLLSLFIIYMVFKMQEKKSGRFLSIKQITLLIMAIIIGLLVFQSLGHLMGRTVKYNLFDYLALYGGAEFHNLNLFINNRLQGIIHPFFGSQTFRNLIAPFVGSYYFDLPFIHSNGYFLGNVGTTFYSLLYDFGYMGCMIMVAIMAIFSQYYYERIKGSPSPKKTVSIKLVFWGYIFNAFVFAFFSNWFFENTVSITFLEYLLYWFVFNLIFCYKVRFKTK